MAAAEQAGVVRDGGEAQLTDEVIGQVVAAGRPARAGGHGAGWEALEAEAERITGWVEKDLSVVKIADLLARRGVLVPYRTLHRFSHRAVRVLAGVAVPRCGSPTVSRGWSVRSTSPGWGWSMTRARAGAGWSTR